MWWRRRPPWRVDGGGFDAFQVAAQPGAPLDVASMSRSPLPSRTVALAGRCPGSSLPAAAWRDRLRRGRPPGRRHRQGPRYGGRGHRPGGPGGRRAAGRPGDAAGLLGHGELAFPAHRRHPRHDRRGRAGPHAAAGPAINSSRGGLVDEQAPAEALAAGRIGAAAFDTFEREPPKARARSSRTTSSPAPRRRRECLQLLKRRIARWCGFLDGCQTTDLAVGGSNPSRRATKPAGQRPCGGAAAWCQVAGLRPTATTLAGTSNGTATICDHYGPKWTSFQLVNSVVVPSASDQALGACPLRHLERASSADCVASIGGGLELARSRSTAA
jgi:hypothetical protein